MGSGTAVIIDNQMTWKRPFFHPEAVEGTFTATRFSGHSEARVWEEQQYMTTTRMSKPMCPKVLYLDSGPAVTWSPL